MSNKKIDRLTPDQAALIPEYAKKWKSIGLSVELSDRRIASAAIRDAYTTSGKVEPGILFFDSPNAALEVIVNQLGEGQISRNLQSRDLGKRLKYNRNPFRKLESRFEQQIVNQIDHELLFNLRPELSAPLMSCPQQIFAVVEAVRKLIAEPGSKRTYFFRNKLCNCIYPYLLILNCCFFDFCISVLGCDYDSTLWNLFQAIAKNCDWIFPYEKICFVCDRPIKLSFDHEGRLHADNEPAILYADGFAIYANHGELITP